MPEGAPGLLATLLDAAGDNCAGDAPIVHAPSKLWFLVLYRDHAKAISRYLQHRYGSGPPEPDDITHEAFAKLAALDEAERQTLENPKAFLYRIAENLLISAKRKARVASAHAADENYRERRSEVTPERVIAAKND